MKSVFDKGNILLPGDGINYEKWSVIACDQYTSQKQYWDEVGEFVGPNPSTLYMIMPECFTGEEAERKIYFAKETMSTYLETGKFKSIGENMVYIERTLADGRIRKGLLGIIDLEKYNYSNSSKSLIRASEKTVEDRIDSRIKIKQDAPVEIPHVMLFIDDPENVIVGTAESNKKTEQLLYDFKLMKDAGAVKGYAVSEQACKKIITAVRKMCDKKTFNEKYGTDNMDTMFAIVADGNHSLAAAKKCYEKLKKRIGSTAAKESLARYALVELVNIYDPSIEFEAIHRVVTNVSVNGLLKHIKDNYSPTTEELKKKSGFTTISYIKKDKESKLKIKYADGQTCTETVQKAIEEYIGQNPGASVDYIHGEDVVRELSQEKKAVGFILPCIEKETLFQTIIQGGPLPKKTFSVGSANDKRFYLEARQII